MRNKTNIQDNTKGVEVSDATSASGPDLILKVHIEIIKPTKKIRQSWIQADGVHEGIFEVEDKDGS